MVMTQISLLIQREAHLVHQVKNRLLSQKRTLMR